MSEKCEHSFSDVAICVHCGCDTEGYNATDEYKEDTATLKLRVGKLLKERMFLEDRCDSVDGQVASLTAELAEVRKQLKKYEGAQELTGDYVHQWMIDLDSPATGIENGAILTIWVKERRTE